MVTRSAGSPCRREQPATRHRASTLSAETSTLIVPLDGGDPTAIPDQRLFPASDRAIDPHRAFEGVILGEPPGGSVVVEFETGTVRSSAT